MYIKAPDDDATSSEVVPPTTQYLVLLLRSVSFSCVRMSRRRSRRDRHRVIGGARIVEICTKF